MKTLKIRKLTIKLCLLLSFLALAESYELRPEEINGGSYQKEARNSDLLIVFRLSEVLPNRQIHIYYTGRRLIVSQRETPREQPSLNSFAEKKDIKVVAPDYSRVVLNPSEINPAKYIIAKHSNGRIYVYQREEPEEFEATFDPEEIFHVYSDAFNPNKTVLIFFSNGEMKVTQVGVPEETNPTLLPHVRKLQVVTSDRNKLLFHPGRFSASNQIKIQHRDGEIFLWAGRNRAPTFNVERPEIIEIIAPEAEAPEVYDAAVDSDEILKVHLNEFDLDKLVQVFFDKGKLKVTQVGAPEETNPTLMRYPKRLQVITSDHNKLLFHPARFSSDNEINMQHKGNSIYLWTRRNQIPLFNIDSPEIIEVITPEIDAPTNPDSEFNASFETGNTIKLPLLNFDRNKLVSISFEDNQLKVTQVGVPEETREITEKKHDNLQVISPDANKLLLHPARISKDRQLNLRHENGQIYVWQGSDQVPTQNIDQPGIVKVMKPVESQPPASIVELTAFSGDKLTIPPGTFDEKKLISVFFKDNRLKVIQDDTTAASIHIPEETIPIEANDKVPLVFYPNLFNLNANIYMQQMYGKIFIWQESGDLPKPSDDNPDEPGSDPISIDLNLTDYTAPKSKDFLLEVANTTQHNDTPVKIETDSPNALKTRIIESSHTVNISSGEFNPTKLVSISWKANFWTITQIGTLNETLNRTRNYTNLQIVRPSTEIIFLHTAFIDPEVIQLRYKNGKIYLWQGGKQPQVDVETDVVESVPSVPEPEHEVKIKDTSAQPKTEDKTSPIIINITDPEIRNASLVNVKKQSNVFDENYESGRTVKIPIVQFDPNKQVLVSFRNNRLEVTQKGAPAELSDLKVDSKNLKAVKPESSKLFLHLAFIDPKAEINFRHENGKIYIWQGGDQPKIDEETPLVQSIISSPTEVRPTKPTPKITFNQTIESARTLIMSPDQFDHNRVVMILYKNNALIVTQVNVPEEWDRKVEDANSSGLQIIRPDTDWMYLHAACADLKQAINFRHQNGKIYIWQGTMPTVNVDTFLLQVHDPIVEASTRSKRIDPEVPDFHATCGSNFTRKEFTRRFNLRKLLSVRFENNELHLSQINTPAESATGTDDYRNLQVVIPDTVTLFIHLVLVDPNLEISFRHENGRIYIWQGSDQLPQLNFDMPNVVQIVELPTSRKEPETVKKDLKLSFSKNEILILRWNMYNLEKLVVVEHGADQIKVYQKERGNDDNTTPGYEELHRSVPQGSAIEFDPRKIDPNKKIYIVNGDNALVINTND